MRFRLTSLALTCLTIALASRQAPAAEKAVKPTVVARIASFDTLFDNAKYLLQLAGKAEEAKELQATIKKIAEGKDGLDKTRPIGIYAMLTADISKSTGVLMVPINKPKEWLKALTDNGVKLEEQKGGLYQVDINVSVPLFLRFANGYAYVTLFSGDAIAKEKLLTPEVVFAATPATTYSITLHIDEVPAALKMQLLAQIELVSDTVKKQGKPGETREETELRVAMMDGVLDLLKTIANEGGPLSLVYDSDRANSQSVISFRLAGVPDSPLAARINRLSQLTGLAPALLAPDSAVYMGGMMSMPESFSKMSIASLKQSLKMLLEKETDKEKKELAAQVFKIYGQTIASGESDGALDFRGPSATGKYTAVYGVKIKDGLNLEKAVRAWINKGLPEEAPKVTFDVEKAGRVSIHKVDVDVMPAALQKILGSTTLYFAVRDDAAFVTAGENALPALKNALTLEPKRGPVMRIEVSLARLIGALPIDQPNVVALSKEYFKKKGSDRISVVVQGGKEINLQITVKDQVAAFFFKLIEAKKGL